MQTWSRPADASFQAAEANVGENVPGHVCKILLAVRVLCPSARMPPSLFVAFAAGRQRSGDLSDLTSRRLPVCGGEFSAGAQGQRS